MSYWGSYLPSHTHVLNNYEGIILILWGGLQPIGKIVGRFVTSLFTSLGCEANLHLSWIFIKLSFTNILCQSLDRFIWWRTLWQRRKIYNGNERRHQLGLGSSSRVWTQFRPGTFRRAGIHYVPLVQRLHRWYQALEWRQTRDPGVVPE